MSISERLKQILETKKMSVAELQKSTGMKKSTIYDIMNGTNKSPRIDTLQTITKTLNISLDELTTDERKSKVISKIIQLENKELELIERILEKM